MTGISAYIDELRMCAEQLAKDADMTTYYGSETASAYFDRLFAREYSPLTEEQTKALSEAQRILNNRGQVTTASAIGRFRLKEAAKATEANEAKEKRELEAKRAAELAELGGAGAAEAGWLALRKDNPNVDRTGVNGAEVAKFADLPHPKKLEYARFAKGVLDSVRNVTTRHAPDSNRWTGYRVETVVALADGTSHVVKRQG